MTNPVEPFSPAPALSASARQCDIVPRHLGENHVIHLGRIPSDLYPTDSDFEQFWAMRPAEFPELRVQGKLVRAPRWQKAFGHGYRYSGQLATADPVPSEFAPYLAWVRDVIDERMNGILVNWYDGQLKHYIGRHRDSRHGLVQGAPITTISFGEERVFRLRPWRGGVSVLDYPVPAGTVVVLPYDTNLAWTHEVPHSARYRGWRISLTFRAFDDRKS